MGLWKLHPFHRPDFIHEYELTPYSLYAAVSIGLTTDDIINFLETLSKVQVPEVVNSYIREKTSKVGRIKLVLMVRLPPFSLCCFCVSSSASLSVAVSLWVSLCVCVFPPVFCDCD